MATSNKCIDCGTTISSEAKRCNSCATRYRWTQPEQRKKMCAAIKRVQNTIETKAKVAAASKARWADPEYRARNVAGIRLALQDPKVIERRSEAAKKVWQRPGNDTRRQKFSAATTIRNIANWKDPEYAKALSAKISVSKTAAWHNPQYRRNVLEGFARRERRNASNLELLVKAFLEANFIDVIHQYVPDEDMSPGIYDFYIPEIDTIIETDDDQYWHTLDGVQKKDLEKEEWALGHDYSFIRIKESDAKNPKYLRSLLKELLAYE